MQTPSANGLGWDLDRAAKCHMCTQCFKALQKPKRCKGCGLARYCSRECQLQHWEQHKFPCKKRGGREGYLEERTFPSQCFLLAHQTLRHRERFVKTKRLSF